MLFLFWSQGLFEVPVGESRSPSGGDTAALWKALVMDAVCPLSRMLCAGDWSSGGRAAGGRGTSEAFSHGSLKRQREMQYLEGNPVLSFLLQRIRHARMHSGDRFWLLHPHAGKHFATAMTCGDISDSIWGSPVPPMQRVQAGWVQAGSAEPGSTSIHATLLGGGEKTGHFFFSPCIIAIFLFFWSSRKAVSFSASAPSARCGRRRQIPAAVGLGSCSASQPGPNARVLLAKKGFARQTWICLAGAGGDLFPAQPRGCGVGSGCKWPVCLSVCLSGIATSTSTEQVWLRHQENKPHSELAGLPGGRFCQRPLGQGCVVVQPQGGAAAGTSTASAEPAEPGGPGEMGAGCSPVRGAV